MKQTLLFPPLLLLLICGRSVGERQTPVGVREYYIAAVETGWDYIHLNDASEQRVKTVPQKYIKAVYREYTDSTYTIPKARPSWAGIQGPTIITQAGHRVVVHFKNLASQSYSISPVGITYWKQSEGAGYDDSTAGQEKDDDAVSPGGQYEYVWDINPKDGPTVSDPECLTYSYSSQVDTVRDMNSGLMGALLICKSTAFTEDGRRRHPAFVLLLTVFDETQSWYGERMSRDMFKISKGRKVYHTVNGYVNSTLPGLTMCHNHPVVFWHLIGMGTTPEIHSIHFHDHSLQVMAHRKVNLDVISMSFITAEMKPTAPGHFLISCQIHSHRYDGMNAEFRVEKCPEPEMRNVKMDSDEISDEDYASMFNTVNLQPMKPPFQVRSSREQSRTWKHFIAAEEILWDYTPHLKPTDSVLQSGYLPAAPHHLGYKYKKVAFVEYTDGSFTRRKNLQSGLLGPVLKGKVNDEMHIIFKNMASRPFNIYPIGLTKIFPLQHSSNANNLSSMGVPPNETYGYIWRLTSDNGPLKGDPQCLTQLYRSTFSPEKDLASGLAGTLLICKYNAIDTRGRLLGPDEKLNLIFAVFDENKSWYFKENMKRSGHTPDNATEQGFYESNVIYSINGIMFSGRQNVMCQTDVIFWHVANVGTQSDFLSVYFTGNLFQRQSQYQSVLTLFPMTAETISMETELIGEWEISAFDSSLKNKGMSIRYTVLPCNNRDVPLVDYNINGDISDYLDEILPLPRGLKPQNELPLIRLCKRPLANNQSHPLNVNQTKDTRASCELRKVPVALLEKIKSHEVEGIPEDILGKIDREGPWKAHQNQGETGLNRRRRHANGNWTESKENLEGTMLEIVKENVNSMANIIADNKTPIDIVGEGAKNVTDIISVVKTKERTMSLSENNKTVELKVDSEFILSSEVQKSSKVLAENMNQNWKLLSEISGESEWLTDDLLELDNIINDANTTKLGLFLEYNDYINGAQSTLGALGGVDPRSGERRPRLYYIAAEETTWDYGIRTPHPSIKHRKMHRGMRKFLPEYKKVVFRAYMDDKFECPISRGELQEHLGILGPFIGAEINEVLTVTFKNKASRPYSFHLHGVYDGNQRTGKAQTDSDAAPGGIPGEPVSPGESRTYNWNINKKQGPTDSEFNCKTGAYYSAVDKEKDLHSGLIGPLVICKVGTLEIHLNTTPTVQDFSLLFHTFDETKSWYLQENLKKYCTPPCQANIDDPWYHTSNKFAAINGYVAETLPGLMVTQHQQVRWHLLNLGRDKEFHAVHFHGLPFTVHTREEHRMGVFSLFPGVFGTVEMTPSTVGTWLVECTIGDYQLAGMRAKLLVYDPHCSIPLGMKSGWIKDLQITASDHVGNWEPGLARLEKSGYLNAWMGQNIKSWLQIDLQKPTLLHAIETQGVRSRLRNHYITFFNISYSLDQETWTAYRGYSSKIRMLFPGNMDSSTVRRNRFSPPFVARYIRIQPFHFVLKPALRLELLGCDINSCSLPLGLKNRLSDNNFTASSFYSSLVRSWSPSLARLHQTGGANAWRPKNNNPHEWLQVDLGSMKRITGVITQGARSVLTEMMVTEFSVTYSQDEHTWSSVLEDNSQREKIFTGNNDVDEEALNFFDPPLFGRYVRIHPRGWFNDIALRLELLGCITQPGV